jgi:hypothetical protein
MNSINQSNPDKPARILIVDDEAALMNALCNTLGEQGYVTVGFTKASEALSELQKNPFDILLSDLMMPEMDGITFLEKATQIDSNLSGIIMTGQGTIDTAVEAMKTGALDYILKPFKIKTILPVLSRALNVRNLRLKNAELNLQILKHTKELEIVNKELESFSYSISHDLRAPLRAITGFSQKLLVNIGDKIDNEGQRLIDVIINSIYKMNHLIEGLLSFSRLGKTGVKMKRLDIELIVKDVLSEIKNIKKHHAKIIVENLMSAFGDRMLIHQVFMNLLSNAVKYSAKKKSPEIRVGSFKEQEECVFYIKDNGTGFSMDHVEQIFGVFQRLHNEADYEGTGIGLAIVQRIIIKHGGRVWAEGKPNEGAVFYFTLPQNIL